MTRILIADDHEQITEVLAKYAQMEGFETRIVHDGEAALACAEKESFDMILLDVMMPKLDGFSVCRSIRKTSAVPIIMITARSEDFERIMGLDIGADDYIVKPFSPREVMARIRAILRRSTVQQGENEAERTDNLVIANLEIHFDSYDVLISGEQVLLTRKEIDLLWLMATHQGKVFSRSNLLDSVWGMDYFGDPRTVDSHIKRLRAKLDQYKHPGWDIATVWGVGYKFEAKQGEKT